MTFGLFWFLSGMFALFLAAVACWNAVKQGEDITVFHLVLGTLISCVPIINVFVILVALWNMCETMDNSTVIFKGRKE